MRLHVGQRRLHGVAVTLENEPDNPATAPFVIQNESHDTQKGHLECRLKLS